MLLLEVLFSHWSSQTLHPQYYMPSKFVEAYSQIDRWPNKGNKAAIISFLTLPYLV